MAEKRAKQIVVISDTHCNSTLGLCRPEGHRLDDGGTYKPSKAQKKIWGIYEQFLNEWVPRVTKGEPWDLVINGDAIDGDHHKTPTIISRNMQDQFRVARETLAGIVSACRASGGTYYHIRGTEAHVGPSGQEEERLAEALGAEPDEEGNYSRWVLWKRIGPGRGHLVNFTHHIGGTGSQAYEGTAPGKEIVEMFTEAGRWGREAPQILVRSHRHRRYLSQMDGDQGYYMVLVTAAWQLCTPFTWRIPVGRAGEPQFGGSIIRVGDEEVYCRSFTKSIERSREE